MKKSPPAKSGGPTQAKAIRRRTAAASADQEQISAAIAPLQSRWSTNAQLRPVTAASMRGIRAKAARLGLSPDEIAARGGAAIADVVRAIADARDASGKLPIFFLAGSDRDAAYGLEAALALADGQRRLVVALFGTRARPEHALNLHCVLSATASRTCAKRHTSALALKRLRCSLTHSAERPQAQHHRCHS